MLRNTKVVPINQSIDPTPASVFAPTVNIDDEGLRGHFSNYVRVKLCYHPDAAEKAEIMSRINKAAFEIEIWTLIEKRSVEWEEKSDDGKPAQGDHPQENLFENHHFAPPNTILDRPVSGETLLENTRKKEDCPDCNGTGENRCIFCSGDGTKFGKQCLACRGRGSKPCSRCGNTGKIIKTARLKVAWETVHSTLYHHDSFIPDEQIKNAKSKSTIFDHDEFCQNDSLKSTFPNLIGEISKYSPVDFGRYLEKDFEENHTKRVKKNSSKIRKIQCRIRMINILEIQYRSGIYTNSHPDNGKL